MSIDSHPPPRPDQTPTTELPQHTSRATSEDYSGDTGQRDAPRKTPDATCDHPDRDPQAKLTDSERILQIDPPPRPPSGQQEPAGDKDSRRPEHPQDPSPEGGTEPEPSSVRQHDQAPDTSSVPRGAAYVSETTEPRDNAEHRKRILDTIIPRHGIDTEADRETIAKAFDTTRKHLGPVIVHATSKILDNCKTILAEKPDAVIVFLGRDADTMAMATKELDPDLFDRHCREAPISRCLADTIVQDLESNAGKAFPEIEENFRTARNDVDPDAVPGSRATMTRFLESRGIPVGTPGATIILVDTSYKGTVQSLMSVAYPEVEFHGEYLVLGGTEGDPHVDRKHGILLHQNADGTVASHDRTIPIELAAALSDKDTVLAIEQSLRGPYSKAERFGPSSTPEQHLEPPPLDQINPLDVAPGYRDTAVRLAIMDVNQVAVGDFARDISERRRAGEDVDAELAAAAESGLRQVRSWATRSGADTDPDLAEMMDAIVRRADKHIVNDLHTAIQARGLTNAEAADVWRRYQQLDSADDKEGFLSEFHRTTPTRGDEHG